MPIIVTTLQGTLSSDVTKAVRVILNDMLDGDGSGEIFNDSLPYVIPIVNDALRQLTDEFIDAGVEITTNEGILYNVPPCDFPSDPNATVSITNYGTWTGGQSHNAPFLPPDLIIPLKIWTRQSGSNQAFIETSAVGDGLPAKSWAGWVNNTRVRWDWYQNTLWLNGTTVPIDLRIRYKNYLQPITDLSQYIPYSNCIQPLAYLCASLFETSRGNGQLAQLFETKARNAIDAVVNRTTERKSRVTYRRRWRG